MEYSIKDVIRNKKFLHYFILYSLIFIFSFIISIVAGLENTSLPNGTIYILKKYTSLGDGNFDIISILANNFLISIIFLYCLCNYNRDRFKEFIGIFYFLKMGLIGGLLISKAIVVYNLVLALSMIVPHGIIEIPTVIYAFSSGWALSELKEKQQSIRNEFIRTSIILFILLSISAYIEIYITPYIFEALLSYYY